MKKNFKSPCVAVSASLLCPLLMAGSALAQQAQSPPPDATPSLDTNAPPVASTNSMSDFDLSKPLVAPRHSTKNEVSVSGDFLEGFGHVTVPFGFALATKLPTPDILNARTVESPTRQSSDVYGSTISYSFGQAFYLDLSYETGDTSGSSTIPVEALGFGAGTAPSEFTIQDDTYQAYLRYVPVSLRGAKTFAYFRGGVTYVKTTLTEEAHSEGSQLPFLYNQTDNLEDIIGNVGFGVGHWLHRGDRVKYGLQFEGEGFFGYRHQNDSETVTSPYILFPFAGNVGFNNQLYGGIGRATFRFEWKLNHSGLLKLYSDAGVEAKITEIDYSSGDYGTPGSNFKNSGTYNELLWGPYVKVGLSYDF